MNFNNSNVQGGASELKETWNDNLATTFEATHDGHDGHHEEILLKKNTTLKTLTYTAVNIKTRSHILVN